MLNALLIFLCIIYLPGAISHGRLISPLTRKGDTGYEDDPTPGFTSSQFVCRHTTRNNDAVSAVTAGDDFSLRWRFGAAHVGDCSVFVSYDVAETDLAKQKYFKIANLPDCRSQNNEDVTITIPDWLPAGDAILRWDWPALHTFPNVEFYSQCADITITSGSTVSPADIESYSIISPPIYPKNGHTGVGYRNPFNPSSSQFMTGPACARDFTGNNCGLTAVGTEGNTGGGGDGGTDGGGGGGDSGDNSGDNSGSDGDSDGGDDTEITPVCAIHTVKSGETLSTIASYYRSLGYEWVTWEDICFENQIISCDSIDVGDTYIVPGTCVGASGGNNNNGGEPDKRGGGSAGAIIAVLSVVVVIAAAALYMKGHGKSLGQSSSKKFWAKGADNTMV